ncbi:hypothetical protein NEFER03_1574 [Nematocida sp. LUAm3]|nr:hypothetical protein NEFER03_1574 [Nematocida sp. LUAm3]KAI5174650.1 hypothetical protein NEFER02_0760 [Nematocida sp. LUAm2]KAI5177789.1 hypothetical protein NEFER01_0991 [Nematocida sp. LUAm1]
MEEVEEKEKRILEAFESGSDELLTEIARYVETVILLVEEKKVTDKEISHAIQREKDAYASIEKIFEEAKEKRVTKESLQELLEKTKFSIEK